MILQNHTPAAPIHAIFKVEVVKMPLTITDKQFQNAYRSAGLWFVALYTEAFLIRIDELKDEIKRTHLVEEIFDNGEGFDKEESGTRTRVNSLWRIIRAGRIIQALEVAVSSSRLQREFPEAAKTACDLLSRIENGSFTVPEV